MNDPIKKYVSKGILLDTNLLILLVVGLIGKAEISKHKTTGAYIPEDFDLLFNFLKLFKKIVVTPHVLAETSNLVDTFSGEKKSYPFLAITDLLNKSYVFETHLPAIEISGTDGFTKYGLTDIGLIKVAKDNYLLLTDDLKMSGFAEKSGVDVINFNHIRWLNWN